LESVQAALLEKQGSIESRLATWAPALDDVRQTLTVMEGSLDERCAALEQRMDRCNPKQLLDERLGEVKSFVMQYFGNLEQHLGKLQPCAGGTTIDMQQRLEKLQEQLDAVQARIEKRSQDATGSVVWHMKEAALKEFVESTCKGLAERMEDVQSTSETRCTSLNAELGELKLQVRRSVLQPTMEQHTTKMQKILEEKCCILEATLKEQIEQVKYSEELSGSTVEGLARQMAALEEQAEKRCATLEVRIGSANNVPEFVKSIADGIHRRINTMQAIMERRCCIMESQVCALHKDINCLRLPQEDGPMPQAEPQRLDFGKDVPVQVHALI